MTRTQPIASTASPNGRLDWVDTAKGISIILVVMMYSAYSVGEDTGGITVLHWIIGFATPFRMPEFFLISGLFLSQVIDRPFVRYADRRVVHYFYFYVLWAFIHIVVKTGLGQANFAAIPGEVLFALVQPYGVLWFIYLLGIFSLTARAAHDFKVPHWLVLLAGAALQIAHIQSESYIVEQFAAYFVYFYIGYVGAPLVFKLAAWADDHLRLATLGLLVWAVVEIALVFSPGFAFAPKEMHMGLAALPGLHLALAVAGALAICVGAVLLTRLRGTSWLTWLGAHSIVVYLAFALPMSTIRIAALKTGIITDPNTLSLVVFFASLIAPVVLYGLVQWTGYGKFLFERPRWAHLPGARPIPRAPNDALGVPAE